MADEKTIAVAQDENEIEVQASPIEKVGMKDKLLRSKPVKGLRKHWKGAAAGAAAAVAVVGAAVVAARAAADGAIESPFDVDSIADAVPVDLPEEVEA